MSKKWHEDAKGRGDYKNMLIEQLGGLGADHSAGAEGISNNEIDG